MINGNYSILLASGDIDMLGYMQSILRNLPLTMRDAGVNTGKYSGSQHSKESKPLEHRLPAWHLVMAAFAGLLGGGWGWWNLTLEEKEKLGSWPEGHSRIEAARKDYYAGKR